MNNESSNKAFFVSYSVDLPSIEGSFSHSLSLHGIQWATSAEKNCVYDIMVIFILFLYLLDLPYSGSYNLSSIQTDL